MNLSFSLTSSDVEAGGELSGKLIINSRKPIHATDVELYFRGKEYTEVEYSETEICGDKHRSVQKTAYGKYQFIRIDVPVHHLLNATCNNRAVQGLHEIPFRIALPCNIPSTMSFRSLSGRAAVAYCLRTQIKGSGFFINYQATQPVHVLAFVEAASPVPHVVPPTSLNIRRFCLMKMGEMTFGARVESTILVPGQAPKIQIALVNNSLERLKEVKLELREVITWSAGGNRHTSHSRFCIGRFPEHHFAGSQKLDKESFKRKKLHSNSRQNIYCRMNEALNGSGAGLSMCTLPIVPQDTHTTFQGMNIQVSHYLRAKFKTKFGSTNPEFSVPVQIVQARRTSYAPSYYQEIPHHDMPYRVAEMPHMRDEVPLATAEAIHEDESTVGHHKATFTPVDWKMNPDYVSSFRNYEPPINPSYRDKRPGNVNY